MRIGVITTSYPRQRHDPAGNFVAGHVDWLVRSGHQIDVLCAGDRRDSHDSWQAGVRIHAVPSPDGLFYRGGAPDVLAGRPALLARAAGFAVRLATAVARHRARWQHIYAHWIVPSALAALPARGHPPITAVAHSGGVHLLCRLGLVAPAAAILAARRARIAFVSQSLRERFVGQLRPAWLSRRIAENSAVIPMGLDVEHFRRAAGRAKPTDPPPVASSRSSDRDVTTILFLGRLVTIKGAHILIECVRHLAACSPAPVRLVIAGDGPERGALADRAAALGVDPARCTVELVGEVRGEVRDQLLAGADVLVMPSLEVEGERSEGSPVTVLEAMASELPVIASRTGGLADLPGDTVTMVAPGSPRQLADAITRLLDDSARRARQVASARAFVETRDWSHIGPALRDLTGQDPVGPK